MMEVLSTSVSELYSSVVSYMPKLFLALIVLVAGYFAGKIVENVSRNLLLRFRFETYLRDKSSISAAFIFSVIFKWAVYLYFLQYASEIAKIGVLTAILSEIISIIPGVIGATAVLLGSYVIGIYVKDEMLRAKELYANILGKLVFFFILYVGIATALELLKIPTTLINTIFLLFVGAVALGIAIAIGLGLKDLVAEAAENYIKSHGKAGRKRSTGRRKKR